MDRTLLTLLLLSAFFNQSSCSPGYHDRCRYPIVDNSVYLGVMVSIERG